MYSSIPNSFFFSFTIYFLSFLIWKPQSPMASGDTDPSGLGFFLLMSSSRSNKTSAVRLLFPLYHPTFQFLHLEEENLHLGFFWESWICNCLGWLNNWFWLIDSSIWDKNDYGLKPSLKRRTWLVSWWYWSWLVRRKWWVCPYQWLCCGGGCSYRWL